MVESGYCHALDSPLVHGLQRWHCWMKLASKADPGYITLQSLSVEIFFSSKLSLICLSFVISFHISGLLFWISFSFSLNTLFQQTSTVKMFVSVTGILPTAVLLALSTRVLGSAIPERGLVTRDNPPAGKRLGAYLSLYTYPNVKWGPDMGSGDMSKLDEIYLFSVDMRTETIGAAPYKLNWLESYNSGEFGAVADFKYDNAIKPKGVPTVPKGDALATLLGNKDMKIYACFGGWGIDTGFTAIAKDPNQHGVFADSVVAFLKDKGLHGADMDWEYPGTLGSSPEQYTQLLSVLKTKLNAANMKLSVAVPARQADVEATIGKDATAAKKFAAAVDHINLM